MRLTARKKRKILVLTALALALALFLTLPVWRRAKSPAAEKGEAPRCLSNREALRLPVQGEPEAVSFRKMQLTVRYYTSIAAGTPVGTRTLSFLVMNGEPAVYDGQKPYAPLMLTESAFPQIAGDRATSVLEKIGILDFVEMFFDIFYAILQNIRLLFKLG